MPRKLPAIPVYEIAVDPEGKLRASVAEDRRHVIIQIGDDEPALLDATAWDALCDLRDTLMPKRMRKAKAEIQ